MPSRARRAALLGAVLSLVVAAPALGATIPVAPDGVDSQCTRGGATPCKTLTKAISIAQGNASASQADTITLAAGSYLEPAPVAMDKENVRISGAGIGTVITTNPAGSDGSTITFEEPGALDGALVLKAAGSGAAIATLASLDLDRVWALSTVGVALSVVSPSTGADGDNLVTADSSIFSAAKDTYGIEATSPAGLLTSSADDVKITLRHVTVAGPDGARAIHLDASDANGPALPSANPAAVMTATVRDSILEGASATEANPGSLGVAANSATISFEGANLADPVNGDAGGPPDADAPALFWSQPNYVFLLRQTAAAAIDKGSADPGAGEPATDIYGEPRKSGAATDLGADEWVNQVPGAAFTANPEQGTVGQPVTFTASSQDPEDGFGGGIANYYWDFGDGQFAKTTTPTVEHTYATEGDKFVRLAVEDNLGAISAPTTLKIVVHPVKDLAAPAVEILQPKAGQRLRLRGKRSRSGKRKPVQLTVLGGVTDATGIKQVDVALRLVKRRRGKGAGAGRCEFYGGRRRFANTACDAPVWLKVSRTNNVWRYRSRKGYRLPPGTYELRARGTDIVGNVSSAAEIDKSVVRFTVR